MQGIGGWFRRLGSKINRCLRNFMQGRYGSDKLNTALLIVGVISCFLAMLVGACIPGLIFTILSYLLMGLVLFRMLSRNTYKRYQENRKFLQFWERLKDKEHRHFDCPRCRQPVRVPRHKGKISITCPRCKEKFIRKT